MPNIIAFKPDRDTSGDEKFSQVTRHAVTPEKPANSIDTTGIFSALCQLSPYRVNVTFESNYEACHPKGENDPPALPNNHLPCLVPTALPNTHRSATPCPTPSPAGDIFDRPAMELRRLYPREATSHRNMLNRQKSKGAIIHQAFGEFRSFLRHVGPMPIGNYTLDRINNEDPEYAPGKVRWADKATQNSNKSDTLTFLYSRTGDVYTTSRLAELRGVSAAAIRKRRERGWTDDEIIEGERTEPVLVPDNSAPDHAHKLVDPNAPTPKASHAPQVSLMSFSEFEERLSVFMKHASDADYAEATLRLLAIQQDIDIYREETGEEPFPETPDELCAADAEHPELDLMEHLPYFFEDAKTSKWEPAYLEILWEGFLAHKLPNWWKFRRRLIKFDALRPDQQALIARIDPAFVSQQAALKAL
ncbi:hypothetical protein [Labrys sp. (in: a-proteobacteria)]|uniref:hypothetical protein n=1 Tax=Labrys sp. (in: a-proteobacteria) TaxID=1917972 RepID=UPI0039E2C76D